ncbi:MAG: nucleotidyltransferase family protein [Terriglobales bacterium]
MSPPPDALILCGGLGTRLQGVLAGVPKALAPVGGRPFLAILLEQLADGGVARVVLCTGVGSEQVRAFAAGHHGGLDLVISAEPAPLGTGGALRLALPLLGTPRALVLNGDSMVAGLDFAAFAQFHDQHPDQASFVLVPADERNDAGTVALEPDGRIAAFAEKAAAAGAHCHSAGIYLLPRAYLAAIPAGRPCSLERELVPEWLKIGIWGFLHPGALMDIGTPERLREAEAQLRPSPHDHA